MKIVFKSKKKLIKIKIINNLCSKLIKRKKIVEVHTTERNSYKYSEYTDVMIS